jgi:hypothetical protein
VAVCAQAVTALVVALFVTVAPGVSDADAGSDDIEAPTTAIPVGSFDGVDYAQYGGVFAGHTSTGAFRVPYRITAPVDPDDGASPVLPCAMTGGWVHAAGRMITCSPSRFALQPSRVIDASSHLLFRAAGILGYLLAVLSVALLRAGEASWRSAGVAWLLLAG